MRKNQDELSKIELRKQEKDKRLAQMKTKDGGKKPIHSSSRLSRILYPVFLVMIVLLFLTWLAFSTGFVQKRLSPLSIGSERISMTDYNFSYNNIRSQFDNYARNNMAPATPDGKLDLSQPSTMPGAEGMTWGEYVFQETDKSIQSIKVLDAMAADKGISLTDEDKATLDRVMTQMKDSHQGKFEQFLNETYGPGVTEDTMRKAQEQAFLAQRTAEKYPLSFEYSRDEISKYYDEHRDNFDKVSYRYFKFAVSPELKEEAEKKSAADENESKAKEMLQAIGDEADFVKAAAEYAPEEEEKAYESDEATLAKASVKASVQARTGQDGAAWLFDQARKSGDKTVIRSANDVYVLYFIERTKSENKLPTVRHILLGDASKQQGRPTPMDEKEDAEFRKLAEDAKSRIKTEEDMIKEGNALLDRKKAIQAGRLENIEQGSMVPEFDQWCFDPARKPGDVDVVKTQFGYHVVFFVSAGDEPQWSFLTRRAMGQEKFTEERDKLLKDERFAIHSNSFARKYVNR